MPKLIAPPANSGDSSIPETPPAPAKPTSESLRNHIANILKKRLSEKHLADLRASGLSDHTIAACRFYSTDDPECIAGLLNWRYPAWSLGACLAIPFLDVGANATGYTRVKPDCPRVNDGKVVKYESPSKAPNRAFVPPGTRAALNDPNVPLLLTEGEKKAAKADQEGFPCVGLVGVYGWQKKRDKDQNGNSIGERELIDDLAGIAWQGRQVFICYDSDATTKSGVRYAENHLSEGLSCHGANVRIIRLPGGAASAKVGLDDFLVARDRAELRALMQAAEPPNSVITIIPSAPAVGVAGNPVIRIIPPVLGEPAYLGVAGRFLRVVSGYTEATDAAVLAHFLPAVGTYIGPGPHIFAGGRQPPRLNWVLVGPTSCGRKGTAFAPVDLFMEVVDDYFWHRQRVGGLSSGEGLIVKVEDLRVKNVETGEWEVEPVEKRVLVIEPEFSRVLANIQRDGNILSHIIREAFDSGNLACLTIKPRQADGAHISIVAHITPDELSERFEGVEMVNGFGNRFLWFAVKSDKIMPRTEPIPAKVFMEFAPRLRGLPALEARAVRLNADAEIWWDKNYPDLREDRPGIAGAITARGSSIVLRLALIYAMLELQHDIGTDHLEAALAVWRYSEESAHMLFKDKTGDLLGDKLLGLLSNGPMTKDEFNTHLSPNQKRGVAAVLAKLEAANLIRKTTVKHEGWHRSPRRFTPRFCTIPCLG